MSCTGYRVFQADVLEPASLTLEKEGTIGFWDRNIRPRFDSSFVLGSYTGLSTDELSFGFYSALQDMLLENGTDSLLFIAWKEKRYVPDGEVPLPADAGILTELGYRFGLDYIVSLEKMGYTVDAESKGLNCDMLLRLYDCRRGDVLDSAVYENDLTEALLNDYVLTDYLKALTEDRGAEYARRLKPYWETVERRIYNGGKVVKMGDVFYLRHHPEQAKKLWEAATRLSARQAIRGYINLAWLYEMEGDFDTAYRMLQNGITVANEKGLDNADTDYLKRYMKIIVERINAHSLLEQQM